MKITEHIQQAKGKTLFSLEVLPPKKGEDINNLFGAIEPLLEFKPAFIDVTYHREEYIERILEDGSISKQKTRKRPGTVGICAAIMNKYGIDTNPHIICGGFSKDETENALIDLSFLGVKNVLALQGDALKTEKEFTPHREGNKYASDLIVQIKNMNEGKYLDEDLGHQAKTDFCIGVAGYPEKHFAASTMDEDMKYLKQKVDLGADYIVTQMFFDNKKYFEFVDRCKANGINVPIIPGMKPLATRKHIEMLPKVFYLEMPEALRKAVENCKEDSYVKEIGIEWCIEQCKELKAAGVPSLHFYTMSKSTMTQKICEKVF
jgi:methylenetetrahydrofolate reductase (NADPH)